MNSLVKAARNPSQASWYLRKRTIGDLRTMWRIIRDGRVSAFFGYLSGRISNKNFYLDKYINRADGLVEIDILGMKMLVDVNDEGISRDLIMHRIREPVSTRVYRSELSYIMNEKPDILVLDIGANIGYYALHAADVLDESATIHAIEPAPANVDILKKNIDLNGFNNIEVTRAAIGATTGASELALATHSNRHRIKNSNLSESGLTSSETIETPIYTVSDFIAEKGVSPTEVDVIRLDVEGFETEVFKGMDAVLNSDSPLLINVELHPGELENHAELEHILDSLDNRGFEIVSVNAGEVSANINDFESLRQFPAHWYELTVKR